MGKLIEDLLYPMVNGCGGKLFEKEIFGESLWQDKNYYYFWDGIKYIIQIQNQKDQSDFVKILRKEVASLLKIQTRQIRFFTTVGSPLDRYHATDGFFLWGARITTLDLTINKQKTRTRADILIGYNIENLEYLTKIIVAKLRRTGRKIIW